MKQAVNSFSDIVIKNIAMNFIKSFIVGAAAMIVVIAYVEIGLYFDPNAPTLDDLIVRVSSFFG